ncbi:hypothetical protein BDN70DRAFT_895159 [Pholiota conissans]|uniref:Uncharacterized protein n=1 Tax=Pholiota conissans TaxID=109636 RepID=A0A9P5Z2V8_9AGAR|nr:hypothetical protein BDN70DRAFT_895159 [Pholiota conissans]
MCYYGFYRCIGGGAGSTEFIHCKAIWEVLDQSTPNSSKEFQVSKEDGRKSGSRKANRPSPALNTVPDEANWPLNESGSPSHPEIWPALARYVVHARGILQANPDWELQHRKRVFFVFQFAFAGLPTSVESLAGGGRKVVLRMQRRPKAEGDVAGYAPPFFRKSGHEGPRSERKVPQFN